MAEDLRRRALLGDADALDELLEHERRKIAGAAAEERRKISDAAAEELRKAEQRERLLKQRIAFQDKLLSMRDNKELRFHATIDKLCERIRVQDAELAASRSDLIAKLFSNRSVMCCAGQCRSRVRL